jgi:hypothetical protein
MKIFKTLLLCSAVVLASCSKDDDDDSGNNAGGNSGSVTLSSVIEGEWDLVSFEQQNGSTSVNGNPTATFSSVGRDFEGGMIFNSDGSMSADMGYTTDLETVVAGVQTITETITFPKTQTSGTYQVLSNTEIAAIGVAGSDPITYTVSNLTATTMTWTAPITATQSQGGITNTSTFDVVIGLEKK